MTKYEIGLIIVMAIQFIMILRLYCRFYILKRDTHSLYLGLIKQITVLMNYIAKE